MSTEKYNFCVLQYDSEKAQVNTIATGTLRDKACRPADAGQLVCTDPQAKLIVLHIFQGLLKVILVDTKRPEQLKFKDPFNVRLDELQLHDIALMQDEDVSTLAVLHETIGARRHVKAYRTENFKELSETIFMFDVDDTSHRLISVPKPRGGLLIVADKTVQYYNHKRQNKLAVSFNGLARIVAHTRIDEDGFRYLLGDQKGNLMVLILQAENGTVTGLKLETLGKTSVPSALEYLDDGRVFVGSRLGPNQVIRLASKRLASTGSFIEVLESHDTFSPILDIKSIDLDSTGQQTLVACSGAFADGGLTIVRRGAAVEAKLGFQLGEDEDSPAVVGVWPLDLVGTGKADHLVFSTAFSTVLLRLDVDGGSVEELPGQQVLLGSESSLYIGQRGPMVFQVTSSSVNYKACLPGSVRKIWLPQNGINILHACALGSRLLVGLSNGFLVLFEMTETELIHRKMVQLGGIPSAVALGMLGKKLVGFAGLWCPFSVVAVDLDTEELSPKPTHVMALGMVPRSIHCSAVGGKSGGEVYLFAALPDGTVVYGNLVRLKDNHLQVEGTKTAQIGKESTMLCGLPDDGGVFVLADRPCVVTASLTGRPHFLSVPLSGLRQWTPISIGPASPTSVSFVAVSKDNQVIIGSLDLSQKSKTRLHTTKLCLGETVRRIVHCPAEGVLVAIAVRPALQSFQTLSSHDTSSVILLDERTFEVIDRYVLPAGECVQCIAGLPMSIVVGTADATEREDQRNVGRILSFRVTKAHEHGRTVSRLSLIDSFSVDGAVYSMAWTRERLVASVNGQTCLYRWEESGSDLGWKLLAQHFGHIVGVHIDPLDDHLTIADMMRSASILRLNPEADKLTEVARDYYTGWATFNKFVDKQHVLMADDHGNISQLVMTADPNFVTERLILEHHSAFHLGSLVNVMVEGSLSERGVSDKSLFTKSFIFGTACGTLGTIGVIKGDSLYEVLNHLQKNILAVTKTPGHFNHSDWRSFYNEKRAMAHHSNFIDGDVIQRFQSLPEHLQKCVVLGGSGCTSLPGNKTVREISELVDRLSSQ